MKKSWRLIPVALALIAAIILAARQPWKDSGFVTELSQKTALLWQQVQSDSPELGDNPAGKAGYAVFFSVCDGTERAKVFKGTGNTLRAAWDAADRAAGVGVRNNNLNPRWVKADIVDEVRQVTEAELKNEVKAARHEFYRYGLALDPAFKTAFLETEMNGAKLYEYDNGGVDLSYINRYQKKSGRAKVTSLPKEYTLFHSVGWFCDEDNTVYPLIQTGLDQGRRQVAILDADTVTDLIDSASAFLLDQVQEDGSFIYGIYPRFNNDISGYNIVRHASTLWSLVCRYRMEPSAELEEVLERTIGYMLQSVIYDEDGAAYLYESTSEEIKLGGLGVAVIAMTEYMDAMNNDRYADVCIALGHGILNMMDQQNGVYWHVLNQDFSKKDELRTVYYDGEATFALVRLYRLTGDPVWLNAAKQAVDHFIEADYAQYKDHWVAYSMNEITRYVTDRPDYYEFALKNAADNLQVIAERDTTWHTYLELLMSTFELYDRMQAEHIPTGDFQISDLLDTIYVRANRQLNGFFYPEYAMYMAKPDRILRTFMVRHDGYRVRIDDVQHNIGGYYLYVKNYDKMVDYGLLDSMASSVPSVSSGDDADSIDAEE